MWIITHTWAEWSPNCSATAALKGPDLVEAAQQRTIADRIGVGAGEGAAVLAALQVAGRAVAPLDRVGASR